MEALLITQGLGDAFESENSKGGSSSKTPKEIAEINDEHNLYTYFTLNNIIASYVYLLFLIN